MIPIRNQLGEKTFTSDQHWGFGNPALLQMHYIGDKVVETAQIILGNQLNLEVCMDQPTWGSKPDSPGSAALALVSGTVALWAAASSTKQHARKPRDMQFPWQCDPDTRRNQSKAFYKQFTTSASSPCILTPKLFQVPHFWVPKARWARHEQCIHSDLCFCWFRRIKKLKSRPTWLLLTAASHAPFPANLSSIVSIGWPFAAKKRQSWCWWCWCWWCVQFAHAHAGLRDQCTRILVFGISEKYK